MTAGQRAAIAAVATPESPEERNKRLLRGLDESGLLGLVQNVAIRFAVTVDDIVSHSRTRSVAAARHMCWRAISMVHRKSLPEIGKLFEVDHTSVLSGLRSAKRRAEELAKEEARHADA